MCQTCKREIPMPEAVKKKITAALSTVPAELKTLANQQKPEVLYESPGCPTCQESGIIGRLGIFEIIPITRELRQAINTAAEYNTLMAKAIAQGFVTMQQDGLLKVLAGLVPYEDVMRATTEEEK
jgi:type II secretory ATPase GspE/PulE/Tfp pilus assembly ATPase PilB-like protein